MFHILLLGNIIVQTASGHVFNGAPRTSNNSSVEACVGSGTDWKYKADIFQELPGSVGRLQL